MNRNLIDKELNGSFRELRKILNSFELNRSLPSNTFDKLNYQLLNNLNKGAKLEKLTRIIESELTVTYGFYRNDFDANGMASEILLWWNLKA